MLDGSNGEFDAIRLSETNCLGLGWLHLHGDQTTPEFIAGALNQSMVPMVMTGSIAGNSGLLL